MLKPNVYKQIGALVLSKQSNYLASLDSFKWTKKQMEQAIGYLDRISAWQMEHYDKYDLRKSIMEPEIATKIYKEVKKDQLTRTIFDARLNFKLSLNVVSNSLFVQEMSHFIRLTRKASFGSEIDLCDIQKVSHFMRGCDRMQYTALNILAKKNMDHALYYALLLNVPQSNWPETLQNRFQEGTESKYQKVVQETLQLLDEEYNKYAHGFKISDNHTAYFIDTHEKLNNLMYPFLENNHEFGLDAEWSQTYDGSTPTLCLIQLSSAHETMVLDIVALDLQFNFGEREWFAFFEKLFATKNTIYGFNLSNDLDIILRSFPYLRQSECIKFKKLICLLQVVEKIAKNGEVCEKVFGSRTLQKKRLVALINHFFGVELDKKERTSFWDERPLRYTQVEYAAKDSYYTFLLQQKLNEIVKRKLPKSHSNFFKSISWSAVRCRNLNVDDSDEFAIDQIENEQLAFELKDVDNELKQQNSKDTDLIKHSDKETINESLVKELANKVMNKAKSNQISNSELVDIVTEERSV